MYLFTKIKALLKFREAVRMADSAHAASSHRYYVIPSSGTDGKLVVLDRRNFRILKRKGYIPQNARVQDLERECFYCTPYADGKGLLTDIERKARYRTYISWVKALRTLGKAGFPKRV